MVVSIGAFKEKFTLFKEIENKQIYIKDGRLYLLVSMGLSQARLHWCDENGAKKSKNDKLTKLSYINKLALINFAHQGQ